MMRPRGTQPFYPRPLQSHSSLYEADVWRPLPWTIQLALTAASFGLFVYLE